MKCFSYEGGVLSAAAVEKREQLLDIKEDKSS